MSQYNAPEVELKWQKKWEESGLYNANLNGKKKKKFYNLVMFPYPSGDKLHIGHWYNFAPADSFGRYMRIKGCNVFEPIGFDSFGLPAENYAIKTGIHPNTSTNKNIEYMIKQLKRMGTIYDWDKTVTTSSPEYYKWTQWIFLQLYKKGLAYKKKQAVNYCPSCQTVLANEQVQDGKCDRCGTEVIDKNLEQWFFRIRDYSERLLKNSELDWPEKTKIMQENWIGKSEGINFKHKVKNLDLEFEVYDSIPQTFLAQTFVIIAPEHPLVEKLVKGTKDEKSVMAFVDKIKKKKLSKKFDIETDMEGIFTGRYSENYMGTGKDLPIWVASFALMDYGTGIVGCSAHDERDYAFAKKYDLPLHPVLFTKDKVLAEKVKRQEVFYREFDGILEEPADFKGMRWDQARKPIIDYIEKKGFGKRTVNYKFRDWLLSRQRYWGAPIPIIYCKKCGEVPVPEKDLPVELPMDVEFKLKGEGKSPLFYSKSFMDVKCPKCGGEAKRESDTMDTFVCSSWYYLRYPNNKLGGKAFDKKVVKEWLPVDMYIGGPEHACMHLLYARFINMALFDLGLIENEEPFKRLVHQGMITKDGAKMSKSKGNVVSPDSFVDKYGSDVFRMYLMFMGPFQDGGDWNDQGITGIARFIERFWTLINQKNADGSGGENVKRALNKLIKKVGEDIEIFHFNTAVAAMMEFVNLTMKDGVSNEIKKDLIRLIAPIAPHLAEECWEIIGEKFSVIDAGWPTYDAKLVIDDTVRLGVQVNGKVRGDIELAKNADQKTAISLAKANSNVAKYLAEGTVVKEIYVPGKIVGFVVKS